MNLIKTVKLRIKLPKIVFLSHAVLQRHKQSVHIFKTFELALINVLDDFPVNKKSSNLDRGLELARILPN